MLVPTDQHQLWANSELEMSPEALAEAMCHTLDDRGATDQFSTDLLSHHRRLYHALKARR